MKISVVNPKGYIDGTDRWMPLGAVTVATVLRDAGHQVTFTDEEVQPLPDHTLDDILGDTPVDVLCLSGMSHQVAGIHRWISKAKSHGVKVIVGGIHASLCAQPAEEFPGAVVVCGPGEDAVLHALQLGPGIVVRMGQLEDPDAYAWPDREYFGWSRYGENVDGVPAIRVVGARGCPFSCRYCCNRKLSGGRLRLRDPAHVAKEIAEAKDRLKIRAVVFAMADFTVNRKWALAMCERLRELGVQWKATTRVDLVDEGLLLQMATSGCMALGFGVESGDDGVLRILGKGTTCDKAREAFEACRRVGLPTWAMFMTHVPGETPATLEKTKQFARELNPPLGSTFQRYSPLPGSWFWEQIGKWGTVTARTGRGFGPVGFTPSAFVGKE